MKRFTILILIILFSCGRDKKLDERNWNYYIAENYIENGGIFLDQFSNNCKDPYRHNLNLNFVACDFSLDSYEIVLSSKHQILYRGYESKNVKSDTLFSCKDSFLSECELLEVFLFDHKNQKVYPFSEKQAYISSELSDEIIYLYSDGSLKVVHNNWFRNLFIR